MRTALVNGRILAGDGVVSGRTLLLSGSRIEALVDPGDSRCRGAAIVDIEGQLLLPGFVDVQVNGGGGVLFNDDPSPESIRAIGAAHRRFGTTGFMPTLISDDLQTIGRAIDAVQWALDGGMPGVLGIHIEGPFLNSARRGVHDSRHLRLLDAGLVSLLSRLRGGKTVLTLAPEMTTPEMIVRLAGAGVIVAAGHTNASYDKMREALACGVTGFTHLFNAMSQLTGREPGVVGAALSDAGSYCGVIVDGRHVHPDVLKLALKCKPHDRFMLVTDAWSNVGTDLTTFKLQGATITIKDGVCMDENGTLAGSAMDMSRAVRNAMDLLGLDLHGAVTMASRAPASFLGLGDRYGEIAKGLRANFVAADDAMTVRETWIDGVRG